MSWQVFIVSLPTNVMFILVTSCVMWYLILSAYWKLYLSRSNAQSFDQSEPFQGVPYWQQVWLERDIVQQWRGLISTELGWITALVKILPLMGLLGTVDGLINSFQELDVDGDYMQLTGAIRSALWTTLAGLLAALSGVYWAYQLKRQSHAQVHYVQQHLRDL